MPKASSKEKTKKRRVNFSFEAPDAKVALLGGDFNQWNANTHPMKKDESGVWKKAVMLEPGRYEYKFLVDRQWRNDQRNDQTCPNCYGTHNNIIIVA